MHISDELAAMAERMFTTELLDTVLAEYQREMERDGMDASEREYVDACARLPDLLDEQQAAVLSEVEALFVKCLHYSLRFGFERGLYASFQQFYCGKKTDAPFSRYVVREILRMPNIQRHREYYGWTHRSIELLTQLYDATEGDTTEYLISVECVWEDRVYGVLRHAFYLGCRYALGLIGAVNTGENGVGAACAARMDEARLCLEDELGIPKQQKGKTP